MSGVLVQAALPTARAVRWAPGAALAGLLVVSAALARSADRPADVVVAIAATGLAATVVAGLQDSAAALLEALPVSTMRRRVLRLAVVGAPALAVWWLIDSLSAAQLSGPGPLLALTATGVAVAVWAPPRRAVLVGASAPVVVFTLHQVVPSGAASDVVAWWLTDPWWVLATATLLCVAGRRR
ncbi:MAG TPA: hypothetical protein VFY76_11835 [Nocardioides sp.]|nr:hypothetical protein [Nocardioides sp.]